MMSWVNLHNVVAMATDICKDDLLKLFFKTTVPFSEQSMAVLEVVSLWARP